MKVLIAALLYGLLFSLIETVSKKAKVSIELSRKFTHIVAGTSAGLLPFFISFHEIAILGALFIPVMLYSRRTKLFKSIHDVARKTYGEICFPIAIVLSALLFPQIGNYLYAVLVMAVSDGFAAIVGQKYGKRKYRFGLAEKSYIGSMLFLLTAFAIGCTVLLSQGREVQSTIIISIVFAAILTLVEGVSPFGLDNLFLPLVAGILLSAI